MRDASADALNLRWLLRLRWILGGGQLAAIAVAAAVTDVPAGWLAGAVSVSLGSNALVTVWVRGRPEIDARLLPALMALDVMVLTVLLFLTGGPANPFTILYLVYVALAAVILPARVTWIIGALAIAGFGSLFLESTWMQGAHGGHAAHAGHGAHATSAGDTMYLHLVGMWIAFAVAACFIGYFLSRVTRALAEREAQLARERARAARSARLASLATLAAGAAHELSTPLSTIAVVAKDLAVELGKDGRSPVAEDAALIRSEVERCRAILEKMAADAGDRRGEAPREVDPRALVDDALSAFDGRERVTVEMDPGTGRTVTTAPKAVAQVLRGILENARDASDAGAPITVRVEEQRDVVRISVRDRGRGMTAEEVEHATDPFFTTKEPGRGMGLGLFLASEVVEQLGGSLDIETEEGRGSVVTVSLPLARADGPVQPRKAS